MADFPDRLKIAMEALIRRYLQRVDYMALYPAKVLQDHGDNTLDLEPDDARFPKLVAVPVRLFVPGATVEVKPGARVLLAFESGNPARPVAQLWEAAGGLKSLVIKADAVQINGESVSLAGGGPAVARAGDSVSVNVLSGSSAGTWSGTITSGSSKVVSG